MPVQTCLPVCIWIGFPLIRENKRFRSEKWMCLIRGSRSVFPNWTGSMKRRPTNNRYSSIQHYPVLTNIAITFTFSCLTVHFCALAFFSSSSDLREQLQLDPICLRSRFSMCCFVDGPGAFCNVADGGFSKQADPGSPSCAWVLLKAAEVPTARPANSGSVGTTDLSHPCFHLTSWHLFAPSFHSCFTPSCKTQSRQQMTCFAFCSAFF